MALGVDRRRDDRTKAAGDSLGDAELVLDVRLDRTASGRSGESGMVEECETASLNLRGPQGCWA